MFLIIGVLLMLVQAAGFFHEVGIAFLIASLLGFSIDFYLHRSIAKDAFEGAMGYFLPDDVKEAVRYLGGMDWFAEKFSLTIKLELEGELIKCTLKTRKYLRNISNITSDRKSNIHVDDWGHAKMAEVISCEARTASVVKYLNTKQLSVKTRQYTENLMT